MRKTATVFASISGCIAVILGPLGAHGLSKCVDMGLIKVDSLHAYETAAHYQMLHAIALVAIVALPTEFTKYFKAVVYLFMYGVIFFSGSLYLLVLGDYLKIDLKSVIGPITPIGGFCLIAGWFMLFLSALKYKDSSPSS
jgi:uncharacterized membrane protein YgdD (TMEM256/DUF423 family)